MMIEENEKDVYDEVGFPFYYYCTYKYYLKLN